MESLTKNNILIKTPNWLGDMVLSLPALGAMRRAFPRSNICVVGNETAGHVLALSGLGMEFVHFDRHRRECGRLGAWRSALSALRGRGWSLGVTFSESFSSALLLRLAGARRVVGYAGDSRGILLSKSLHRHRLGSRPHLAREFMGLALAAGATVGEDDPAIAVPARVVSGARELFLNAGIAESGPLAGFCPGAAYGPSKRWPAERFSALGRALVNRDVSVIIFGSPSEVKVAAEIADAVPGVVSLAGKTTVTELAGCLSRCSVVVANDSGAAHLAACVSAPVVAIFGSTDAAWTRPLGRRVVVVKADEMPCAPCFGTECDRGYACLTGISEEEVLSAALSAAGDALR